MCADGWDYTNGKDLDEFDVCPDCGAPIDEDGDAVIGCHWSPRDCETCGAASCDGSC